MLIEDRKYGWFLPPRSTVQSETSAGDFKSIGATDVTLCSMVALVTRSGSLVTHLSQRSCELIREGHPETDLAWVKDSFDETLKPFRDDMKYWLKVFKKECPEKPFVVIAVGPQAGSNQYGVFIAKEFFGLDETDIHRVIYLTGASNRDGSSMISIAKLKYRERSHEQPQINLCRGLQPTKPQAILRTYGLAVDGRMGPSFRSGSKSQSGRPTEKSSGSINIVILGRKDASLDKITLAASAMASCGLSGRQHRRVTAIIERIFSNAATRYPMIVMVKPS